jgi:YVTN family beta-propeller protein
MRTTHALLSFAAAGLLGSTAEAKAPLPPPPPKAFGEGLLSLASLGEIGTGSLRRAPPKPRVPAAPATDLGELAASPSPKARDAQVLPLKPFPFRPFLSGGSVAVAPGSGEVFVADTDNGTVVVADPTGARVLRTISVGDAPEQVVVDGKGRAYVTLRDGGKVAAIDPGAECATRAAVGAEPFGVALSPDEKTLFVSLVGAAEVAALDARTLDERYRVKVDANPRGLTAHPDGRRLYVAHLTGRSVSLVDLEQRTVRPIGLADPPPPVPAVPGRHVRPLPSVRQPNLTFAVALTPGGERLFVPHVLEDTGKDTPIEARSGGYGGAGEAFQPIVASVARFDAAGETLTGRWTEVPGFGDDSGLDGEDGGIGLFSQPRAITVDPVYSRIFVAGLGSNDVRAWSSAGPKPAPLPSSTIRLGAGAGTRGIAVSADGTRLYVHTGFKHQLVVADVAPGSAAVRARARRPRGTPVLARLTVGEEKMAAAAVHGRALFFGAHDTRVSAGGGLACASCHPEGRNDGMVWRVPEGPRKTPILADRLVDTGPYDWRGRNATLVKHIEHTIARRIGGTGLPPKDLADLETYLTGHCKLAKREAHPLTALQERGRRIFRSDEVGCANCHAPGAGFRDGKVHDIGSMTEEEHKKVVADARTLLDDARAELNGLTSRFLSEDSARARTMPSWTILPEVYDQRVRDLHRAEAKVAQRKQKLAEANTARLQYDTPSLVAVASAGPYFHDGSAATLRDVIATANTGDRMGRTSQLPPGDVDALVAYLETL